MEYIQFKDVKWGPKALLQKTPSCIFFFEFWKVFKTLQTSNELFPLCFANDTSWVKFTFFGKWFNWNHRPGI